MLLNLDSTFTPYGPGVDFKSWMFSGGEIGFKLSVGEGLNTDSNDENYYNSITITTRLTSSDRTMELLMATDALRRRGFSDISLVCPYLPYARQDRVMVEGESLSLRVFADLINSQGYSRVVVYDIHNVASLGMFNNIVNISSNKFVKSILPKGKNFKLIVPDAGALKKIYDLTKELPDDQYNFDLVKCDKVRDVSNGEIRGISINETNLGYSDCYIVDDCVDGGRTFIEIAKILDTRKAGKIYLVVSHGIFSSSYSLPGIAHTYCTDSFKTINSSYVTQIHLDTNLLS